MNGMVVIDGWVNVIDVKVIDLVKCFVDVGVLSIVYIDIVCDGMM